MVIAFVENVYNSLQRHITRFDQSLSCEESDPMQPRVQSLHRIHLSYIKEFRMMHAFKNKLAAQEESARDEAGVARHDDIAAFAREMLGVTLYDHQLSLCRSDKRVNLLVAGRGAGKSLAAQVKAVFNAVTQPRHTVLVVSSGQRMSSDFGAKLRDLLRESKLRANIATISNENIRFKNGSVVHLLPANPDTIRGYHPKASKKKRGMTVILDEACFMEQGEEIRKAVEYALITTRHGEGQLYIVTSPTSRHSWVYPYVELSRDPSSGVALFQYGSAANPQITAEEIERLRSTKNELEFRAEVLGEWVDGAYSLFAGLIEPNVSDVAGPPPPQAIYALGADLALSFNAGHDNNALAVAAAWLPDDARDEADVQFRLVDLLPLEHASDRELRETVRKLSETYPIASAVIEQFQGKGLAEYCQMLGIETELAAATAGQQRLVFHDLHRLLRQRKLQLPRTLPPQFFEELKNFEYRMEGNGRLAFGHPTFGAMHDDTVYAAAWSLYAAQRAASTTLLFNATAPPPEVSFIQRE